LRAKLPQLETKRKVTKRSREVESKSPIILTHNHRTDDLSSKHQRASVSILHTLVVVCIISISIRSESTITMHPSLSLALISLLTSFTYGFSSQSSRWQLRRIPFQAPPVHGGLINSFPPGLQPAFLSRGGGTKVALNRAAQPIDSGSKCPVTGSVAILGSMWGTGGVLYILAKAIKRVLPIAMEPFQAGAVPLSQWQLG
jgi:hypothetical protein